MCILGLNSVSLYHCIIPSQHLNSMMLLKYAQLKVKINLIQFTLYRHTELGLVREVKIGSEGSFVGYCRFAHGGIGWVLKVFIFISFLVVLNGFGFEGWM